jgi:hypothetical protein
MRAVRAYDQGTHRAIGVEVWVSALWQGHMAVLHALVTVSWRWEIMHGERVER